MSLLTFQLDTPDAVAEGAQDWPVEVRNASLSLAGSSLLSGSVNVDAPGLYFVNAHLPTGQTIASSIEIRKEDVEKDFLVEFLPDVGLPPAPKAQIDFSQFSGESGSVSAMPVQYPGFLPASFAPTSEPREMVSSRLESMGASEPPLLRAFVGEGWDAWEPLDSDFWLALDRAESGGARLRVLNSEIRLVQLIQIGQPVLNILAPIWRNNGVFLTLQQQADGSYALSVSLENTTADALLRFRESGQIKSVEATSASPALDAKELIYGKMADPVGAAIGMYALLRLGALDRLDETWTANLCEQFPWLPDGSVIRGEYLARLGRHVEALDCFLALAERGLPNLCAGLSYAQDRLRIYQEVGEKSFDAGKIGDIKPLLTRLARYAQCADFQKPLLTFVGLNPNTPNNEKILSYGDYPGGVDAAPFLEAAAAASATAASAVAAQTAVTVVPAPVAVVNSVLQSA